MDRSFVASVVVPTFDRCELLASTLVELGRQVIPGAGHEVIVVDDGSRDGTAAVVENAKRNGSIETLMYIYQENQGLNAARNAGIAAARAELICFLDDDVLLDVGWLESLVAAWKRRPEAGCYGGPMLLELEGPVPRMCGREPLGETELVLDVPEGPVEAVFGGNMTVTRSAVMAVGDFKVDLPIYGEELEWQRRHRASGGEVIYVPSASVRHRRTEADLKLRSLIKGRVRRGRSGFLNAPWLGDDRERWGRILSYFYFDLRHALGRRCAVGILNLAYWYGYSREKLTWARRSRAASAPQI